MLLSCRCLVLRLVLRLLAFVCAMPLAITAHAATPGKATNPNPAQNAYDIIIQPKLFWNNGGGAQSYRVYFGTSANLDDDDLRIQQSGTSYQLEQLQNNTTYYWRIDSQNLDGNTTGDTWRFKTFALVPQPPLKAKTPSPANNAIEVAIEPELTWANGGDARTYSVYFGLNATLGSGDLKGTVDDLNRFYEPGTLDYNTTYYWRIDSTNPSGTTAGTTWKFKTKATPPPLPPTSPDPADGQVDVIVTGFLTWADGGGATSYDVYFGDDPTPDSGEKKPNQTTLTFNPGTLQNNKLYYWKIVARNDEAGSGGTAESPVWVFRTQAAGPPLPPKPMTPVPANGATNRPIDQLLGWTDGGNTGSYDVYLGTDATLDGNDLKFSFLPATAYNPGILEQGTTYYWRVDARNENGVTAGDVWSFTTVPPGAPPAKVVTDIPLQGIGGVPLTTNVSWHASETATSYDVYFGTTAILGPNELRKNLTGLFYYPGALAPTTKYYWRVDARNEFGVRTGDVRNFTTREATAALLTRTEDYLRGLTTNASGLDANGDGRIDVTDLTLLVNSQQFTPSAMTPAQGATVTQVVTEFTWTPVTGAMGYLFELRLNDNLGQADVVMAQLIYGPSFTLDLSLFGDALVGQNVRWSVRAFDTRAEWGAWMPLMSFTYQP